MIHLEHQQGLLSPITADRLADAGALTALCGQVVTPATREESDIIGTFYVHWAPTPRLYAIEVDEGFSLADLLHELGRMERQALGYMKHGDTP